MVEQPLLSVVVTSYTTERLKDILELLDSLKAQTYSRIEVIFVGERSRELCDRVKEYGEKTGVQRLRVIFTSEKIGLGGARNLASKEATGEIVAFVDDDVILSSEWADEMVKSYEDSSVIGVTGACLPQWQDKKLDWLPKELYWLISCTDWTDWNETREARSLWGGNMSVRREVFEKAGSFLPLLGYHAPMAEDLEFSLKAKIKTGGKLLFNPKAKVWHKVYAYRVSLKFVSSRAHHIGVSRRLLRTTYLKQQAPSHLEHKVVRGMARTLLLTPLDLFKSPRTAWKRLVTTLDVLVFAGLGYAFPGKAIMAAVEIERCSRE